MTTTLETRLCRLEAANRRLRVGLWLAVAASVFVASRLADAKPERSPKLKVEQLELTDADGKVRGRLGIEDDGASSLTLMDAAAEHKAVLTVNKSGSPGLVLRNAQGKGQVIVTLGESGPAIVMTDAAGEVASSWTFRNDDNTSLIGMRLPGDKKFRAVLTVMKDGRPYLKLSGPDGELRVWDKREIEFQPAGDK